ncbi:MAG: hypothetical protein ACR2MO_00210 [Acidimicrobiales bacterium]
MHPMERLRSVARATGAGPGLLVQEAAGALSALGDDPAGLVTACRRLVERHPAVGPMWWLASRVLCAPDPMAEAWRASAEIDADATPAVVCAAVPEDASVVLVGWPEQVVDGLRRRGDVEILLVSGGGESTGLARRLRGADLRVEDVADAGLGAAVADADLVLLEAGALGPESFLAPPGSRAAAAVAHAAGVPVWVVVGVGRALPARIWRAVEASLARTARPVWDRSEEVVPLVLCDRVVGPSGLRPPAEDDPQPPCVVAPELLKSLR